MRLPAKEATALTADPNHAIGNLIDQDTNTFYASSGDNSSDNEWVEIELLSVGKVREVQITNPVNCCDGKLTNIEVRVGDKERTNQQTNASLNNKVCGTYSGTQKNGDLPLFLLETFQNNQELP